MQENGNGHVAFIVVRPQFLGNIGSIARLLKNFGFRDLRFVEPPRNYKDAEARKMAVAAFDLLKNSTTYATLADAIADLNVVIGTSSGQQRKEPLRNLNELAGELKGMTNSRIGVVLGDEIDGLRKEELFLCQILIRIPTDPEFPSLNLAQAAGIIAYELRKEFDQKAVGSSENVQESPLVSEVNELFDQVSLFLEKVEFARDRNKGQVLNDLKQFYHRAKASKRETDLLRGIIRKLNGALNEPVTDKLRNL
jgi:TrmH family RNA methyltransferase